MIASKLSHNGIFSKGFERRSFVTTPAGHKSVKVFLGMCHVDMVKY